MTNLTTTTSTPSLYPGAGPELSPVSRCCHGNAVIDLGPRSSQPAWPGCRFPEQSQMKTHWRFSLCQSRGSGLAGSASHAQCAADGVRSALGESQEV